ncbi:TKL protein kinase [Aphanomyces invadans]|uniref:TKL protein kinase n=1 Tax=Aphanomyces invadans TaxID=157072 RepID=A0A024TTZ5_9STRA|nr:TKL protein kinase [Aphanomyces invadans]ETV97645.1 TKL protein kinase [Aphanomyces invadans]|eukprot:XP_008873854.1 TKL protein kinase [Aphanomyces invadans]
MGCSSSTQAYAPTPAAMLTQKSTHTLNKTPRGGRTKSVRRYDPTPTTSSASGVIQHASAYPDLAPYFGEYFVDCDDLLIVRQIPATYMKTAMGNLHGASVLIKSIDSDASTEDKNKSRKALVSEISSLARIAHPNIVGFVGFSIEADTKGLVCLSEFMEGGTLRNLLDNPRAFARLTWSVEKIGIAIDICSALVYMHSLKPRLIHRNVKASKVLLNKNRTVAKLSGFGGSRDRTFDQEMTNNIGDIQWSAPELIMEDEDYTEKVDVYSFGVLLTELDTGLIPFADVKSTMAATAFTNKIVSGALRPQLSPTCPPAIANVVKHCLQQDPHIRPASERVLHMLLTAKAELARSADE